MLDIKDERDLKKREEGRAERTEKILFELEYA